MPSEFNDHLRLKNVKKLQSRNAADTNWVDMLHLDTGDDLVHPRAPRVQRFEFDRMPRPLAGLAGAAGGAPTGTAGDENLLLWPRLTLEYHILGTQTIVAPVMTAVGLDLGSMDQTANDGLELCPGVATKHDMRFVVGTDAAFYVEAKLKIADVSGTDDLAVGFRKLEAYQANVDDYDEMAALNVIAGAINVETILNGAATATTDTTDTVADAGTVTLRVDVSAAGVVTFKIDGQPPTTTAAFTFDDAEVVVPFIYFLQDTDIAGTVELIHLECGRA